MIDEQRTLEIYGYTSDDLKPHSGKPIVVVCEECGNCRVCRKSAYHELCKSCASKLRCADPSVRKAMSEKESKRCEDPNVRKALSERAIKQFSTQEARDKASYSMKKHYSDPLNREKASERANKRWSNPDERKKASEASKKQWADPLNRDKLSASHKKLWEDPAFREKVSGENSYAWKGGISYGKYCPKFDDDIKQYIRDKYNNCDYISGIHKDVCSPNRALDVHHVDYNKQQGCDDHEWILIPLSAVNHIRTNFNRPFWNKLFTYALQYDETYFIGEDIDTWRML